jgi:hypothetical protein
MYFTESNFIDTDSFDKLNKRVSKFYKLSKLEYGAFDVDDNISIEYGRYNPIKSEQEAKRVRFWCNSDDVEKESLGFFGNDIREPVQKLRQYIIDKGYPNIKLSNIWLQYGDMDTKMHRHSDGAVKGAPIDKCFTSLLFCHEHWDDSWGGILHLSSLAELDKIPFSPKPNTMVMWTRDHPHWMTPINQACPLRMFLGMSWYE